MPHMQTESVTERVQNPASDLTFHITTFGCQMNVADSSTLAATMKTRGYRWVENESEADLIVLNTCSVREKAEERVYGRLGDMYRFKRERPWLKIAVVGCMAQRLGPKLAERVPHVDYVLGTDRLFELPDVLEGKEGSHPIMTAFGHENMDLIAPVRETPFSGYVTISRGCDNYCTYCIVPYVRGKERSHSTDYIVDSVRKMVDDGVVEVTLLGQNVNSYRYQGADFPDLLARVARETNIQRIRYTTSHPKDCTKKLINLMAEEPKIMPYVHLPVQSGSNRVLRKMGRFYSVEHYLRVIDYIREKLPLAAVSTDIIVGFPTETEEEFEQTLDLIKRVRYDFAYMFRYSPRPGTVAAKEFDDDITEVDKVRRLNKLIRLQQQISYEKNQAEVGQIRQCLIEGCSRRDSSVMRGRTETNKTVLFDSNSLTIGNIVSFRISSADAFTLHGERVLLN